jgi:S-formylglutathione hydrolase FrmB
MVYPARRFLVASALPSASIGGLLLALLACSAHDAPVAPPGAPPIPPDAQPAVVWTTPAVSAPRVQYRTFVSAVARATVSYHAYVPARYDSSTTQRFPVLYWLHGSGGGNPGIAPLSAYFDAAIRAGRIPPMLVVFPNGMAQSMWVDAKDGRVPMERMVIGDLIPQVDATYRTVASPSGRLVEGFSMGGYGAARFGLLYPNVFGAMSMLAAGPLDLDFDGPAAVASPATRAQILRETYGDDMGYFRAVNPFTIAEQYAATVRGTPSALTRIRVAIGDQDFTLRANEAFHLHLERLGIVHEFIKPPGIGHESLALLNALGEGQFAFYRSIFGTTSAASGGRP